MSIIFTLRRDRQKLMTPVFLYIYTLLFKSWTYENFTEFHYNIDEGTTIFQCGLFLCPQSSSKFEQQHSFSPHKICSLSQQPRIYAVMLSLFLRIMLSSQGLFLKGLNTWQSDGARSGIYSRCCNTVLQKPVMACVVGIYVVLGWVNLIVTLLLVQ